jgi:hypothetical protein
MVKKNIEKPVSLPESLFYYVLQKKAAVAFNSFAVLLTE